MPMHSSPASAASYSTMNSSSRSTSSRSLQAAGARVTSFSGAARGRWPRFYGGAVIDVAVLDVRLGKAPYNSLAVARLLSERGTPFVFNRHGGRQCRHEAISRRTGGGKAVSDRGADGSPVPSAQGAWRARAGPGGRVTVRLRVDTRSSPRKWGPGLGGADLRCLNLSNLTPCPAETRARSCDALPKARIVQQAHSEVAICFGRVGYNFVRHVSVSVIAGPPP